MENKFPIITLTNGVRVMNFNSPHPFNFEDGSILPAVSDEIAKATQLDSEDIESENEFVPGLIDVHKRFVMSDACRKHLYDAAICAVLAAVDIILVPLPVLLAFKESQDEFNEYDYVTKLRAIYMTDRISKQISITKFCI